MMIAVVFKPIIIGEDLTVVITFYLLIFVATYFALRAIIGRRNSDTKKSDEELLKLSQEWYENGTAIANWLRIHLLVGSNFEAIISNLEFQELLRKDFDIYNKLIILDPKLKGDPIANKGRDFYRSLIRTKNTKPS